jgi:hypothetical protein
VIKSRNADVEAVAVSAVEGKPLFGGDMLVKPLIKGDEMTFLEIHYAAGVGDRRLRGIHHGTWRCLPTPKRSPPRIGGHRRLRGGRDQVAGARDRDAEVRISHGGWRAVLGTSPSRHYLPRPCAAAMPVNADKPLGEKQRTELVCRPRSAL